jgi:hypothetical protein
VGLSSIEAVRDAVDEPRANDPRVVVLRAFGCGVRFTPHEAAALEVRVVTSAVERW